MDADYEKKLKEYGDNARKVLNIAEKRENTKKDEKSSKNAIDKTTKQSYKEVYDIICNMEKEMQSKIPQNFISFIKENMDFGYEVNIDYSNDINKQKLLPETRNILALIYRDYILKK